MDKSITFEIGKIQTKWESLDYADITVIELLRISSMINGMIGEKHIKESVERLSRTIEKIPQSELGGSASANLDRTCYFKINELVDEINKLKNKQK